MQPMCDVMMIKLFVVFHSRIVDCMNDVRHVYGRGISLITQRLISIQFDKE